jgi:hypothetical protein
LQPDLRVKKLLKYTFFGNNSFSDMFFIICKAAISDVCMIHRLRWFWHVERKGYDDWVKRCTRMEVVGKRPRGRPRKTWMRIENVER